ncbi:MAG TPA: hypothetical protein VJ937_06665 [Salinivirga sp.]|uniref:hypothetical protein n=1 Tax=Salinivirga sp. TaxID=1970192 RepID=UPI002B49638A|nr:hypothetical protein [Salinivirga sp.]HKK59142.1 hypothetical protein [Salinivirga sp.]
MSRIATLLFIFMLSLFAGNVYGQYSKDGYRFEHKIKAPRVRRPIAHELMLDPQGKYLIVTYSSHPTVVVLYDTNNWLEKATYQIPKWFDLSNSFMGPKGKFLYLDFERYSSKYRRINLQTNEIDTLECYATPRGCMPKEGGVPQKEVYTDDKTYYITINKRNRRDILVFRKED